MTALLQRLVAAAKGKLTKVTATRPLIYQYDPAHRFDPEATEKRAEVMQGGLPLLPLPRVPKTIREGRYYVVTEALFTTALPPWRALHWRALIDVQSGAVLYLRAFVTSAFGNIFRADPFTLTGDATITPASPAATLDPLTDVSRCPGSRRRPRATRRRWPVNMSRWGSCPRRPSRRPPRRCPPATSRSRRRPITLAPQHLLPLRAAVSDDGRHGVQYGGLLPGHDVPDHGRPPRRVAGHRERARLR